MNMNKTTGIVGGIIVLVAVGVLIFYAIQNQNTVPSSDNSDNNVPTSTNDNQTTTGSPTTLQAGLPIAVTNSSVVTTDTTAVINGTVTPNGAFTNYWYEYGITSNLGNRTLNQMVGSGHVTISAPGYITGLTKNTTYYFRLVAENQYGKIAGTQYSFQTTQGTPPPVGSAPTAKTLDASGISRTVANLNGKVNPNMGATQYWFEYGKTANLGNTVGFVSVGDGDSNVSASVSISNLDLATTYYFRINAQNQFGTVNGSILNFKTTGQTSATAPSAITGNATLITASTATLRGTVNPKGMETMYWFEYSSDSLLGSALLISTNQISTGAGANAMSVETRISNLSPKTNYYFRVVAQNDLGIVRGDRETFKTK